MAHADLGPPGFYVSSSQGRTAIADMHAPHIERTIAKIIREHGADHPKVGEMRFQLTQRSSGGEREFAPLEDEAPASHRLERADGTPLARTDNHPPAPDGVDPFLHALEQEQAAILQEISLHEMAASDLPKADAIKTDEDVAKITAWVTTQKALHNRLEKAREIAKAPHLEKGRKVDAWFGDLKVTLKTRWETIEKRPGAYLIAKRNAEQARLTAEAAKRAAEAKAADELAAAALLAEQEASRLAQEANQAILQAQSDGEIAAAEQSTRQALLDAASARSITDAALAQQQAAGAQAEVAARIADPAQSRRLERTVGGGGAAALKVDRKYRITGAGALNKTLGPLGAYLTDTAVNEALARAAKADPWPAIAGVEFYEEESVSITGARNRS